MLYFYDYTANVGMEYWGRKNPGNKLKMEEIKDI